MNLKNQQFIRGAIITVIVAGAFGALSILAGGIGQAGAKLFTICFSLIFFGITATISMIVTRKPEYKGLGTAGLVVSVISFFIFSVMILAEIGDPSILQLAFAMMILSIALAHICLLHYFNLQNKYALYARMTATIAISIFSLILITRIFEPFPSLYSLGANQSALKLLVAALVVDLAATLLVPLCNQLKVNETIELTFTDEQPAPPPVQEEQTPLP